MPDDEEWFRLINGWAGQFPVLDWLMFQCSQESNLYIPGILALTYWGWTKWEGRSQICRSLFGLTDWFE